MGNMMKITDYTEVTPSSVDYLLLNQNGNNKKTTVEKLLGDVNTQLSENTQDIANLETNKINKTSIVNNLTTTVAGSVLDAVQGKALLERIVMYKSYPVFTNGVATITLAGITSDSVVMTQWVHGTAMYIYGISCSTNTITLTTDATVNGTVSIVLLIQKIGGVV